MKPEPQVEALSEQSESKGVGEKPAVNWMPNPVSKGGHCTDKCALLPKEPPVAKQKRSILNAQFSILRVTERLSDHITHEAQPRDKSTASQPTAGNFEH